MLLLLFSLQEVKSQPQNMLMDSLFSDPWTTTFSKILCRQGFIIAKSMRLQGLLLLVYTQMKHVTHLRDIEAQYTKTGLGGMWVSAIKLSLAFMLMLAFTWLCYDMTVNLIQQNLM